MTRLYGRAKGVQRVVDDAPAGHWCTTTMISSIRIDGSTACMVVDGTTNKGEGRISDIYKTLLAKGLKKSQ